MRLTPRRMTILAPVVALPLLAACNPQSALQIVDGSGAGGGSGASGDTVPYVPLGSVWDDLAECEASGDWSIDTGNGYSGGLQFHPDTWDAHGGEEFADEAHQATRSEQIVVGERVLDEQGWGAWPSCADQLGLG